MTRGKLFSVAQILCGAITTILVAVAFLKFNSPLQMALRELDSMSGKVESEIQTVESILEDIDGVAHSIQESLPAHTKTLEAVGESAAEFSRTVITWEEEIPGVQQIAKDAAQICDTFASQLPIRVPDVKITPKRLKFELPEIIPKTQEVEIPYPTAKVDMSSKSLKYPSGAKVESKEWRKDLGSVAGKSLGSISFSYPSGITISRDDVKLTYPSGITIGSASKSITVPATPQVTMKDYSFDIPDKLEISYRELMTDEKLLLQNTSAQLVSASGTLETTKTSLGKVVKLLDVDIQASLDETRKNLESANDAIISFREDRLPVVLSDMRAQREGLHKSRDIFSAIGGLVPLMFLIAGLIPLAITASGAAKLFPSRSA